MLLFHFRWANKGQEGDGEERTEGGEVEFLQSQQDFMEGANNDNMAANKILSGEGTLLSPGMY